MVHFDGADMESTGLYSLDNFKKYGKEAAAKLIQPVVISINIKNLKYFNDIYGFNKGDELIAHMHEHFCIEDSQCIMAAKSYVDHVVLLSEGGGETKEHLVENFNRKCDLFLKETSEIYPLAKIHIGCGMYIMDPEKDSFIEAQDNARYARRSVKDDYRTNVAFYSKEQRIKAMKEAEIIPNFERALTTDRIKLYFQPKFTIDTQEMVGAEALSRMTDDNGQLFSPAFYVPILEKAGLVTNLDMYVIERALACMRRWIDDGKKVVPISVNLSRVDFLEEGFIEKVDSCVDRYRIPKELLEFEVTETIFCDKVDDIIEKVKWLREQGYHISMDDFGSGYNSLYIIGKVPTDTIKFDRGFVLHSLVGDKGREVMKSLITMFKKIRFEVICEGVETKEEEKAIQECGCNLIQGFLHDKPLPERDFEEKYIYADNPEEAEEREHERAVSIEEQNRELPAWNKRLSV